MFLVASQFIHELIQAKEFNWKGVATVWIDSSYLSQPNRPCCLHFFNHLQHLTLRSRRLLCCQHGASASNPVSFTHLLTPIEACFPFLPLPHRRTWLSIVRSVQCSSDTSLSIHVPVICIYNKAHRRRRRRRELCLQAQGCCDNGEKDGLFKNGTEQN